MGKLVNRAKMTVASAPGTGAIALGSAVSAYQSLAAAGVVNGDVVSYAIEDGSNWELGLGTYSSTGPTLARTTILASSNGGSAINATTGALVFVTPLASDLAVFAGDSGSGGAQGFVPAPPAGAAAYNQVLGAGGAWVGQMAGFRNRIISGGLYLDQRNAGAAQTITAGAALAYTVDRFYAYCTGATVVGQRVAGSAPDQAVYQFTGAASVTAIGFGQRIEQANCFDLAGTTATLSVKLANSLLTTVTWTAYYATTANNFGTLASPTKTQIATGSFFAVNSTRATYSVQIAVPSAATTGIEIVLSVGAQTSGTWTIGAVQLEPGASATPFERRPFGVELALSQRYYWKSFDLAVAPAQASGSYAGAIAAIVQNSGANYAGAYVSFPHAMRTAPSLTAYSPVTSTAKWYNSNLTANSGTASFANVGTLGFFVIDPQVSGDVTGNAVNVHVAADGEL